MTALSVIILLALICPALGTVSTYSRQLCTTKFGPTAPTSVGTISWTHTISLVAYQKSTVTPSVTVIPLPVTSSRVVTSVIPTTTTLSQITNTFSTISTFLTTITITTTSTFTEIDTTLTTTTVEASTTYTVPPSPNFTPISSNPANAAPSATV